MSEDLPKHNRYTHRPWSRLKLGVDCCGMKTLVAVLSLVSLAYKRKNNNNNNLGNKEEEEDEISWQCLMGRKIFSFSLSPTEPVTIARRWEQSVFCGAHSRSVCCWSKKKEAVAIILPDLHFFHFQGDSSKMGKSCMWIKGIPLPKSRSLKRALSGEPCS